MAYVKTTNFATKDALSSGDPLKIVKGTELNTEFDNISTASALNALKGANSDITSLSGLTTPLSIAQGGTSGATANAARTALTAAASGANGDITSMTALTAPTVAANPVRATDLQAQTVKAATTGGTGTAFTFTPTPAITAYATNQEWDVSFSAACGASPTFQVSGVATPPNLVKQNADGTYSNLSAGAFPSGWQSTVKMVSTTQALVRSLPPGLITASGLTQSTARLLGRTTASTGAVEEITVGTGLTLSAGTLTGGGILGTPVASTSGTSIDFTGIPSGTKQIIITFNGVSTNGTSPLLLQIGTSGGISNTGYVSNAGQMATSSVTTVTSTAGFIVNGSMVAANTAAGSTVLNLVNSSTNAWVSSGETIINTSNATNAQAGNKTLSAVLDRVRVTTVNGTDTFDAGEINIQYQ